MFKLFTAAILSLFVSTAYAAPLVEAVSNNGKMSIILHDEEGVCVYGAKKATFAGIGENGKSALEGCWRVEETEDGDFVNVIFLNGSFVKLPVTKFRKVKSV